MGTEHWAALRSIPKHCEFAQIAAARAAVAAGASPAHVAAHQRRLFAVHELLHCAVCLAGLAPDAVASFSAGEPSGARASGAVRRSTACALSGAMADANARAEGFGSMTVVIGVPAEELVAIAAQADVDIGA